MQILISSANFKSCKKISNFKTILSRVLLRQLLDHSTPPNFNFFTRPSSWQNVSSGFCSFRQNIICPSLSCNCIVYNLFALTGALVVVMMAIIDPQATF